MKQKAVITYIDGTIEEFVYMDSGLNETFCLFVIEEDKHSISIPVRLIKRMEMTAEPTEEAL